MRFIFAILISFTLYSSELEDSIFNFNRYGKGYFETKFLYNSFPKNDIRTEIREIPLYNKPDGEQTGRLSRDLRKQYLWDSIKVTSDNISDKYQNEGILEFDYEAAFLVYYAVSSDQRYFQILKKYSDKTSETEFWIKQSDLENIYLRAPTSWTAFFNSEYNLNSRLFYVNSSTQCLNLRTGPSTEYKKLGCFIEDRKSYIRLTGKTIDNWAPVNVYRIQEDNYYELLINNKYEKVISGYMKIIDDSGYPNLWYYTRD